MFVPGDSLVVIKPLKTRAYYPKNWKALGKVKFAAGAEAVCLGGGRYSIQHGPWRGNELGAELSDAEAAEYLAKKN